jgi:hypothetical protein
MMMARSWLGIKPQAHLEPVELAATRHGVRTGAKTNTMAAQ